MIIIENVLNTIFKGKMLWELVENVDIRINNVLNFMSDICPELKYDICKIADPFGPAIVDPTMDMIIVSEETIRGGEKINDSRYFYHVQLYIYIYKFSFHSKKRK